MTKISILTQGFISPNSYGFLYPFYRFNKHLRNQNIEILIYNNIKNINDTDVIFLDSKYFGNNFWKKKMYDEGIDQILNLKKKCEKIIYFDISDSTGWLHDNVLPYVDIYAKSQLLVNKKNYTKKIYNNRIYCDYYNKNFSIKNKNEYYSKPVKAEYLDKITLGWNSGMANYNYYGNYIMRLNSYFKIKKLFTHKVHFEYSNNSEKINKFFLRMGINYSHETIIYHRKFILDFFEEKYKNNNYIKINRKKYFNQLKTSQYVISPFGLGEITLKDFETFLSGSLLFKPDMSHMITYPNLFKNKETVLFFQWDLSDLNEIIENIDDNKHLKDKIIHNARYLYNYYINTDEGALDFIEHLKDIYKK